MFLSLLHKINRRVSRRSLLYLTSLMGVRGDTEKSKVTLKLVKKDGSSATTYTLRSFRSARGEEYKHLFKGLVAEGIPLGRYDVELATSARTTRATITVGFPVQLVVIDCEPFCCIERNGPRITNGKVVGLRNPAKYWIRVVTLFSDYGSTQVSEIRDDGTFTLYQLRDGRYLAIVLNEGKIIGIPEFSISLAKDNILLDLSKQNVL